MKRTLRILALVMLLVLCAIPLDMAARAETGLTARLHYVAGGYWPATDGNYGSTTTVQITGEGYYTLTASFNDMGGWTPTGSGIEKLLLIVEGGDTAGSVMEDKYLGVSAVRVNGTAVSVGTVGYGPCGYDSDGIFTASDDYAVLYDTYFSDSATTPYGHTSWDGSACSGSAVDPSEFNNVTKVEVDFFVTATQGVKPSQSAQPTPAPTPSEAFGLTFTLPGQTYRNLDESDLPLDELVASIPDVAPTYADGTVSIPDIGGMATRATYYGGSSADLKLQDGVWSAAIDDAMDEAAAYGYVQFTLANGMLDCDSDGWRQLTILQDDNTRSLDLTRGGDVNLSYTSHGAYSYSNFYDLATGNLVYQNVWYDGKDCAEYEPDGSLVRLALRDDNWVTTYYFPGKGWFSDPWEETSCSAPAGYEDVDEEWIWVNFPHDIPGAEEEPTPVLSIPEFTVPDQTYLTLEETGIPLDEIIAGLPDVVPTYADGMVSIPDVGSLVTGVTYYGNNYADLTLQDSVWSAAIDDSMEEAAMYGCVQFSLKNGMLNYNTEGWLQLTLILDENRRAFDLGKGGAVNLRYTGETPYSYTNQYDLETGALTKQEVMYDREDYAEYNPDGSLFRLTLYDEEWNTTCYLPETGWCSDFWGENPCDAPAGYEDVDLAWIYTNFPFEIPGVVVHLPVKLEIPEFTMPDQTYLTLEETGVPVADILKGIPDFEPFVEDGKLRIVDCGADSVSYLIMSDPVSSGSMTLSSGVWSSPDLDLTNLNGCYVTCVAGDVTIEFNGSNWFRIELKQDDKRVILLPGENPLIDYTSAGSRISNEYDKTTGELLSQFVYKTAGYAWYSADCELVRLSLDSGEHYFPGKGWRSDWNGTEVCDAPAGYEDVDEAWVLENYPHDLPEPPLNVVLPSINFPTVAKATLDEMDIDLDAIVAAFPEKIDVSYEDSVLTVQSIGGYFVTYHDYTGYEFTDLTEGARKWSGPIPQTAEQFAADGGWIDIGGENWEALYDQTGQLETVQVRTDEADQQIEINLKSNNLYVQVYHEDADGFRVWTMYDPATGKVKNQNSEIYESDCAVNIFYDADGVLEHLYCHGETSLIFYPNEGWFDMNNNPVDAPALLAGKTAQDLCEMLPCTFTEATVPAPSPKVNIPAFTVQPKTFKTLAETGIPVEEIRAGIPESLEIEVNGRLLFIRDIGAAKVTADHPGTWTNYTATKSSPIQWLFRVNETAEQIADPGYWYTFIGADNAWQVMYINGKWNGFVTVGDVRIDRQEVGVSYPVDGFYILDKYDAETGLLTTHRVEPIDGSGYAEYDSNGALMTYTLIEDNLNCTYKPEHGWTCFNYETGEETSNPPAGYEDFSILWVYENYPPQMDDVHMNVPMPEMWDAELPADLKVIEENAFQGLPITAAYISDGVTTIGERAFASCGNLRWVYIPASVTDINKTAFDGCTGLVIFAEEGSTADAFARENDFVLVLR